MKFEQKFHPKIKNDLKKLDKNIVKEIKEVHIKNIAHNPYKYPKLKGNLSNFFSYHFRKNGVEYRIAYEIEDNKIIIYLLIAKRENFYKNLLKRI